MNMRTLGRTGLEISEIVFGAGAVGGAVFTGPVDARTAVVRRALELGINWIDTASSYGDGQSEENLGRILRELDAAPHVSTKVRVTATDSADLPRAVERSVGASLARLELPAVELIQLHNRIGVQRDAEAGIVSLADVLGVGGILEGFERVREAGRAGFLGFTGLGEVDAVHALVESGRFDTVQAYHNVLNPSASRAVPDGFSAVDYRGLINAAAERGMGVLNIRALAAGVLGGNPARAGGRPLSPGSDPEADAARAALVTVALAREPGTLPQQAIRFALDTPGVAGVLVSFSDVGQVEAAVAAAGLAPLSPAAVEALAALHASDFGRLG